MRNKNVTKIFKILVWLGPLLIAIGLSLHQWESKIAKNLLTTQGRIVTSEVRSTSSPRHGTTYSPFIEYSYEVNGVPYKSDRIGMAAFSYDSENEAKEIIAKYRGSIQVYYDRRNPSRGYLDINGPDNGTLVIVLGALLTLFSLPIYWFLKKHENTFEQVK